MKVLITGANGFIGKRLTQHFKNKDYEVIGLDINEENGTKACDITKDDLLEFIPNQIDIVIHLAALSRDQDCFKNALSTNQVNVFGTQRLVEAAHKKQVRQFIFASTEWVYDNFNDGQFKTEEDAINLHNLDSEYAASKYIAESNLKQFHNHTDFPITVLRFGIIYGPRKENWSAVEALLNSVAKNDTVEVGSLETGRCFLHVDDVISGIEASIGIDQFEIFNLQGNEFVTLKQVLEAAQSTLSKTINISEKSPGQASIRMVSNKKMKEKLNWSPKYNIRSGIQAIKSEVLS